MSSQSSQTIKLTAEGKKFMESIEKLCKLEVAVGYQAGKDDYEDGTSLVEVAARNEFGSDTIPPRPFMKQSFDTHKDQLLKACQQAAKSVANGGDVQQALNSVGVTAKGIVQEEIRDGDFAPNAASTIKAKGSSKPLIDTGHMRQSVNYVIREQGSGSK